MFDGLFLEVRKVARGLMKAERSDHSWQTADLANECLLRILMTKKPFASRRSFLVTVAKIMRRLLIDHARGRNAEKRKDRHRTRTRIEDFHAVLPEPNVDSLEVEEALQQLALQSPVQAEVIDLRYFAGMTWKEIGLALDVSESMVRKHATHAQAALRTILEPKR